MNKITLLVGLPGCGKTFLGNELAKSGAMFIDDISLLGKFKSLQEAIINNIAHIIVADVFLCRNTERINAVKTIHKITNNYILEWIFFDNDPEQCRENVKNRQDGRLVNGLINQLNKEYTIPEGVIVRPVYSVLS